MAGASIISATRARSGPVAITICVRVDSLKLSATPSPGRGIRGAECLDLSLVEKTGAEDRALDLYRCLNRLEVFEFDDLETFTAPTADRIGARTSWTYFPGARRILRGRLREVVVAIPEARIVIERMPTGGQFYSLRAPSGLEDHTLGKMSREVESSMAGGSECRGQTRS